MVSASFANEQYRNQGNKATEKWNCYQKVIILYFLHRFAEMDYSDIECQKRLIKTFVNSVFVYDDKVVLAFNYSGDDRTITLHEIDAGLRQGVRLSRGTAYQKSSKSYDFDDFCFS